MKKALLFVFSMTFLVGCQSPSSNESAVPSKLDIIHTGDENVPLHQSFQLSVDVGFSWFIPEVE